MTARAAKKAETINQIVEFENPDRACEILSPASPSGATTPVAAHSAIAMTDRAPIGAALPMMPTIVARKIAKRCQAAGSSPEGVGMNQVIRPTTRHTASASGRVSRPSPGRLSADDVDGPPASGLPSPAGLRASRVGVGPDAASVVLSPLLPGLRPPPPPSLLSGATVPASALLI